MRGADIRNGALLEERDNLKQQVVKCSEMLSWKRDTSYNATFQLVLRMLHSATADSWELGQR